MNLPPLPPWGDGKWTPEWGEWARAHMVELDRVIAELKILRDAPISAESKKALLAQGYNPNTPPIGHKIAEYRYGQALEEVEVARKHLLAMIPPKSPTRQELSRAKGVITRIYFEKKAEWVGNQLRIRTVGTYRCYVCGAGPFDYFKVRHGMKMGFTMPEFSPLCADCYLDYARFVRAGRNSRYYRSPKGQAKHRKVRRL